MQSLLPIIATLTHDFASILSSHVVNAPLSLRALVIAMACDFATGWLVALKQKKANSSISRDGVLRKGGYFMALIVGKLVDLMSGQSAPLAFTAVSGFLFFTEVASIVENLGALGVPLPPVIKDRLAKLSDPTGLTRIAGIPVVSIPTPVSSPSLSPTPVVSVIPVAHVDPMTLAPANPPQSVENPSAVAPKASDKDQG